MHSRHLGLLRVLCVHSVQSKEQPFSFLSVMLIQDPLKLLLRFSTRAIKQIAACNKHIAAVREIRQLTEAIKYQKYPTVLYLVTMNYSDDNRPKLVWKIPDTISDELILPARVAYEIPDGKDLRHGYLPGIMETSTAPNGCYKSSSFVPIVIQRS